MHAYPILVMDLSEIDAHLKSEDSQERLKAIKQLWDCEADVALPRLIEQLNDPEFLVRTFVCMGLGRHQATEGFAALLQVTKLDPDPNVRAEAANSLSLFGKVSSAHLVSTFFQDDHWLVRRSILAALTEMTDCPEELYEVCVCGLEGEDETVREASATCLATLAGTPLRVNAMQALLKYADDSSWRIRLRVAKALYNFDEPEAKAALRVLAQDADHRVVGATLEGRVEQESAERSEPNGAS